MFIIPGSFSFFIFVLFTCAVGSIIPTCLFLNGGDMTPTSGANATKIPVLRFYCFKISLMEFYFTTNYFTSRPHLAKSPFIWYYQATFLTGTSFLIVLLGLLMEKRDH